MKRKYLYFLLMLVFSVLSTNGTGAKISQIDKELLKDHERSVTRMEIVTRLYGSTPYAAVLQLQSGRYGLEIDNEFYTLIGLWLRSSNTQEEYLYRAPSMPKKVILHSTLVPVDPGAY